MIMTKWAPLLVGYALAPLAAPACAGGGDAVSRQLVAISHLATTQGSLAISDDGGYSFVDSSQERETHGQLSATEFEEVKLLVGEPGLSRLYGFRASDDEVCTTAADSYFLQSKMGTACFVVSDVTDSSAREDLDFLSALYEAKATAK